MKPVDKNASPSPAQKLKGKGATIEKCMNGIVLFTSAKLTRGSLPTIAAGQGLFSYGWLQLDLAQYLGVRFFAETRLQLTQCALSN